MPKADELDFKTGEPVAEETGQSEKTEEETTVTEDKTEEKPVDSLEKRLEKLEKEKDNYKKGMLSAKKNLKKLTLEKEPEKEPEEEETQEWDETSKKFQEQTLSQAEKKAEAKAQEIIGQANEKAAISKFISKNPDAQEHWDDIVSNYSDKNGKETVADIVKDLERAYVLFQYDSGSTIKGKDKSKAKLAELSSVSKTTSKSAKEGTTLSQGAVQMAERMRVDPKKLAQEDDSPYAEIKF